MTKSRFTAEEVIEAYRSTGSVWKAARLLGLSGQTVHGRLKALGYSTSGRNWTEEEIERLREMAPEFTLAQIADEFGRSYASIACKVNELGVGNRYGNKVKTKLPRGAGLDKVSVKRYINDLETSGIPITRYAKQRGMIVDTLIRAIEKHYPDWWAEYRKGISYLPEVVCPECSRIFHPSNTRQTFCSQRCRARYKIDQDYFGGKRKNTIGLAEGKCQLCGRIPKSNLSSHHVLGKENDPENEYLIALCSGCHELVTSLGARNFTEEQWEALISLAYLRKHGGESLKDIVHITVDIDTYDIEDDYN